MTFILSHLNCNNHFDMFLVLFRAELYATRS